MNEIYITDNVDAVVEYANKLSSDSSLPIYIFEGNKEDLDNIVILHNERQKAIVLIKHITKAPMFDILLPIMEESDLHIIAVSDRFDLKGAIISRCEVKHITDNYKSEIEAFINKHIVPDTITIKFLCALSDYIISHYKNTLDILLNINEMIYDIQLSTNNILQDELKERLKGLKL